MQTNTKVGTNRPQLAKCTTKSDRYILLTESVKSLYDIYICLTK